MRNVRILWFCLVVALTIGAVAATSAFAKEPKASFGQFKNCPTGGTAAGKPAFKCTFGETRPGAGGSYTVGGITVSITKPIKLQGAYTVALGETHEEVLEKDRESDLIVPEDGAPPVSRAAETVPGEVLAHVSMAEQEALNWPQALKESYAAAQKQHKFREGTTKEIIEPAGADIDNVSEFDILSENGETESHAGPGVIANVQIQGANKWLESLGGNCFIGSEADPIVQELWTGTIESPLTHETMTGTAGLAALFHQAEIADLTGVELVANHYSVPGATKCGGPANEAFLDPAVNHAFGLPAPAGASTTRLIGELDVATPEAVEGH